MIIYLDRDRVIREDLFIARITIAHGGYPIKDDTLTHVFDVGPTSRILWNAGRVWDNPMGRDIIVVIRNGCQNH